ncbi:MAG: hypothetical protein WCB18_04175 [Thermoplasmata archaeon]
MAGPPHPITFDTRTTCQVCGKLLTSEEMVKYRDFCAAHAPPPPLSEDDPDDGGDDEATSDSG